MGLDPTIGDAERPGDAASVVTEFFRRMEAQDVERAMDLMTEDAVWINVSLPTVRGRARIERAVRLMLGRVSLRAQLHHVATESNVVLTERTDELAFGRFAQRFWVYGRFEMRDGKIAVWRDAFDWLDLAVSFVRAVAGVVAPGLNRRWPGDTHRG